MGARKGLDMNDLGRIEVGDQAPDFSLMDNRNHLIQLSALLGRKVLLSWHPLAWTSVCAQQMKSLEENFADFDSLKTVPLGLSIDSVPSKNALAKDLGISNVSLLADFWPHGDTAKKYGLFREKEGFSERVNVILSETGMVLWLKIYEIHQLPDIDEVMDFLRRT
jgi:peroxiredoxin